MWREMRWGYHLQLSEANVKEAAHLIITPFTHRLLCASTRPHTSHLDIGNCPVRSWCLCFTNVETDLVTLSSLRARSWTGTCLCQRGQRSPASLLREVKTLGYILIQALVLRALSLETSCLTFLCFGFFKLKMKMKAVPSRYTGT